MKNNRIRFFASVFALLCIGSVNGPLTVHAAGPAPVDLLSAGTFTILSKAGISTTGTTSIVGDIGVSPAAATFITGFGLSLAAESAFATSPLVTGKVYAPNYANPTPSNITTAISDMQTAYTDAAGRTNPTATELGAGNIGGMTLAPGLYKWGTGVTIPTDVTLSGGANDVWIFQIAQTLTVSSATKVILSGGAQAGTIFWVVAGQTTIGTSAVFAGTILDQTAITLNTGAQLHGRALAQTAVTLDSNAVSAPSVAMPTPALIPAPTPVDSSSNNGEGGKVVVPIVVTSIHDAAVTQDVVKLGTNMGRGSKGTSVKILQKFMIAQNKGPSAKVLAKIGATGYFGIFTRAALAEFQAKVGIRPSLGNFGLITRAYLSNHY